MIAYFWLFKGVSSLIPWWTLSFSCWSFYFDFMWNEFPELLFESTLFFADYWFKASELVFAVFFSLPIKPFCVFYFVMGTFLILFAFPSFTPSNFFAYVVLLFIFCTLSFVLEDAATLFPYFLVWGLFDKSLVLLTFM